jgi:F0F1-type ATP synthase assembly protein I
VDRSQRRDLTQQMNHTSGSYELVLSPVILAFLAYGLDRWLGTVPVFTVIGAAVGLAGAVVKMVYGYNAEMAGHEVDAPWTSGPVDPTDAGPTGKGLTHG